jgi:hypothetical protein
MTPEERAAANQRQRERRAAIRERLERARLGVLAYFTRKEIDQMREEERARRENMTEEERAEERDAFRDRLHSIGFGAPDFTGLERLRADELRAMAAFIASQRGTRYEEIMEDEEEEEESSLEEGDLDSEDLDEDSREPNPRVSAKRTNEALWKRIVKKVTAGTKGGRPGQWSARKAQLAVAEYKAAGGGYIGRKSKDNSLHKWTVQKWRTKSGRPSLETGERYLPAKAIEALTAEEYRETSRAKRAGMRKGKQFVPQPHTIAHKVAKYRRKNPGYTAEEEYGVIEDGPSILLSGFSHLFYPDSLPGFNLDRDLRLAAALIEEIEDTGLTPELEDDICSALADAADLLCEMLELERRLPDSVVLNYLLNNANKVCVISSYLYSSLFENELLTSENEARLLLAVAEALGE